MEKTFKSWLLSNLLIFMWLTFGLIAIIGFIIGSITSNEDLMMLSLYSCVSIPLSLICSIVGPLFQLAALFIPYYLWKEGLYFGAVFAAVGWIIAIIVAVKVAKYAQQNYDQVISRRTMYRNSKVSIFKGSLSYAYIQYVFSFLLVFGIFLLVILFSYAHKAVASGLFDKDYLSERTDSKITSSQDVLLGLDSDAVDYLSSLDEYSSFNEINEAQNPSVENSNINEQNNNSLLDAKGQEKTGLLFLLSGFFRDGEKQFPIDMELTFASVQPGGNENAISFITGRYSYENQPDLFFPLQGYEYEDGIVLISKQELERFDLKWDNDLSMKGYWRKYINESDLNNASSNYKNCLRVELFSD